MDVSRPQPDHKPMLGDFVLATSAALEVLIKLILGGLMLTSKATASDQSILLRVIVLAHHDDYRLEMWSHFPLEIEKHPPSYTTNQYFFGSIAENHTWEGSKMGQNGIAHQRGKKKNSLDSENLSTFLYKSAYII